MSAAHWILAGVALAAAVGHAAYVFWRVWRDPFFDPPQRCAQMALVLYVPVLGALRVHLMHRQLDKPVEPPRTNRIVNQTEPNASGG